MVRRGGTLIEKKDRSFFPTVSEAAPPPNKPTQFIII